MKTKPVGDQGDLVEMTLAAHWNHLVMLLDEAVGEGVGAIEGQQLFLAGVLAVLNIHDAYAACGIDPEVSLECVRREAARLLEERKSCPTH